MSITDGAMLVLSQTELARAAPVVGAGIGTAVVAEVARRLGRGYVGFADLIDAAPQVRERASQCGPAAALAALASQSVTATTQSREWDIRQMSRAAGTSALVN